MIFYRQSHCCPIENVWKIWLIKIDFGRPNAEIGRKMTNGLLLLLALMYVCMYVCMHVRMCVYTYIYKYIYAGIYIHNNYIRRLNDSNF